MHRSARARLQTWKGMLARCSEFLLSSEFLERVQQEDVTMVHAIPMLSQMNRFGYLTTDSQEGKMERFTRKKIGYVQKQRAYVCGLMHI